MNATKTTIALDVHASSSPHSTPSLQKPNLITRALYTQTTSHSAHNQILWNVHTNASFILTDPQHGRISQIRERILLIRMNDMDHLCINGTSTPLSNIQITSTDGIVYLNGKPYTGTITIKKYQHHDTKTIISLSIMGTPPIPVMPAISNNQPFNTLPAPIDTASPVITPEQQTTLAIPVSANTETPPTELTNTLTSTVDLLKKTDKKRKRKRSLNKTKPHQHTTQTPLGTHDTPSQNITDANTLSTQTPPSCPFKIRVLLDILKNETEWHLTSTTGFLFWASRDQNTQKKVHAADLHIHKKNNQLYINNHPYADELVYISPISGNAAVNGSTYHGAFLIAQQQDHIYLINNIDLEEYVCGVLHTESWPGWPLEIHKVCAIACRSYAIAMASRAHKLKKIYHLKNTNEHQTYTGFHPNKVLRQAVDDTRGLFLAYNNQPIIAMYDICCGGIIPAHIADFNFENAPYLARTYACLHCKMCKAYTWETIFPVTEFEKLINKMVKKVKNIKSISINKKDKAGLVREIVLKNSGPTITFSGKKMYSLMKDIKSLCFQTHKKGNQIIIKGKGYGHHLGLCQWGAREMVRNGWHHKRILQFYYPGTEFMRIT